MLIHTNMPKVSFFFFKYTWKLKAKVNNNQYKKSKSWSILNFQMYFENFLFKKNSQDFVTNCKGFLDFSTLLEAILKKIQTQIRIVLVFFLKSRVIFMDHLDILEVQAAKWRVL